MLVLLRCISLWNQFSMADCDMFNCKMYKNACAQFRAKIISPKIGPNRKYRQFLLVKIGQIQNDRLINSYIPFLRFSVFYTFFPDNRTNFTQGGVNVYSLDENSTADEKIVANDRLGFIGWAGLGGSVFQWHPELKIGFAFVPTCLHWFDVANLRGGRLQKLVVECVNELQK